MSVAPLWSVMIPTYNAAQYLAETLNSVLQQAPDESLMEIVVVDNCSTDSTEEIVKKTGRGRIKWIKNAENVGMINNFNECIKYASGEYIHILNADDLVGNSFYQKITKIYSLHNDVGLVSCAADIINSKGDFLYTLEPIAGFDKPTNDVTAFMYSNPLRTPSVTVRKIVYQKIGGFDSNITFAFDWDMWARAIFYCKGMQVPDILCKYREHGDNETSRVVMTGENIVDMWRLAQKFSSLGMPINLRVMKTQLRLMAKKQYYILKDAKNDNYNRLKSIHKELSSFFQHIREMNLRNI